MKIAGIDSEDAEIYYTLHDDVEEEERAFISNGSPKRGTGVVREKDLTSAELKLFDEAKLKEFRTVIFEKRAGKIGRAQV